MKINPKGWYIITGINKLTRQREDISRPLPGHRVESIMADKVRKHHKDRAFIYLKVKPSPYREQALTFREKE